MATPNLATDSMSTSLDTAFQALKQAQAQVVQFTSDAQEARRERDEATAALRVSKREETAWKEEARSCKIALDQAEIKRQHQETTIAQLHREATQWKDQSRNWQEHFLRVEQERCRLTVLLEELLTENQVVRSQPTKLQSAFTPKPRYGDVVEPPTPSLTAKRVSSSSREETDDNVTPPPKKPKLGKTPAIIQSTLPQTTEASPQVKQPLLPSKSTKRIASAAATAAITTTSARAATYAHTHRPPSPSAVHSRSEPRQTLIRRVNAVIEVPVKEEKDNSPALVVPSSSSSSVSVAPPAPPRRKGTPVKMTRVPLRKLPPLAHDGWDASYDDNGRDREPVRNADLLSLNDDDEEDDEEDDELRMGSDDNLKDLYGPRKPQQLPNGRSRPTRKSSKAAVASKRRRSPVRVSTNPVKSGKHRS